MEGAPGGCGQRDAGRGHRDAGRSRRASARVTSWVGGKVIGQAGQSLAPWRRGRMRTSCGRWYATLESPAHDPIHGARQAGVARQGGGARCAWSSAIGTRPRERAPVRSSQRGLSPWSDGRHPTHARQGSDPTCGPPLGHVRTMSWSRANRPFLRRRRARKSD